jgi:hypothetical protein
VIASDKENEVRVMLHQTALLACGYLLVGLVNKQKVSAQMQASV